MKTQYPSGAIPRADAGSAPSSRRAGEISPTDITGERQADFIALAILAVTASSCLAVLAVSTFVNVFGGAP